MMVVQYSTTFASCLVAGLLCWSHEAECSKMHTAECSVCTIYLVALYNEKLKNLHSCCVNDLIYVYCVLRAYFVHICVLIYIN